MLLRKEQAGSDSFGNTWAEDGAVVEVPEEQGRVLLRIAGFSEVSPEGGDRQYEGDLTVIHESPPLKSLKPVAPKLKNPVSKGIELDTFTE